MRDLVISLGKHLVKGEKKPNRDNMVAIYCILEVVSLSVVFISLSWSFSSTSLVNEALHCRDQVLKVDSFFSSFFSIFNHITSLCMLISAP